LTNNEYTNHERLQADLQQKRRVLATLTVIILLLAGGVPAALYTVAPAGPVTEGDLVYANGRHEVVLADAGRFRDAGYIRACFVEPREALRVVQKPSDRTDHRLVARIEGRASIEMPFCPPGADVLLAHHQYVQRLGVWEDVMAVFR
jgi:hypothetical protein